MVAVCMYGCNPGWQADADADLSNIPKVPADGERDLISDENVSRLHRAVRLILPTNSSPNQGRGLVYLAHVEYSLVYRYWLSFVCAGLLPGGCILQVAATLFPTTLSCDSEYLRTFVEYRQLVVDYSLLGRRVFPATVNHFTWIALITTRLPHFIPLATPSTQASTSYERCRPTASSCSGALVLYDILYEEFMLGPAVACLLC